MKFELHILNCFWLMLPLLAWNLVLGPHIRDPRISSDAWSPKWLLGMENFSRLFVFILPLFIPMPAGAVWQPALQKIGLVVYIVGTLIYFASWLPLIFSPGSRWSNSPAGLLAPRLTPWLSFVGIALIGQSWLYGCLAALFIFFHTWHGLQNFQNIPSVKVD